MKKILVTTDLSNNSKLGIQFAIQLSLQIPCKLAFYHVFTGIEYNSWNIGSQDNIHFDKVKRLKKIIQKVYERADLKPSDKLNCIVESGIDTESTILNYLKNNAYDYLCVSTKGGGLMKKILGTTTSMLIQHSPIPVFVIPKKYKSKPIDVIWFASDLANLNTELPMVKKVAKPLNAEIHLYHYDYLIEVEEIRANLNQIALKYIAKGIYFHFRKMEVGNTLSELLQKDLHKSKPELLILFTHQHKDWYTRFFLPDNTKEVIFDTKTPLLIFKKTEF